MEGLGGLGRGDRTDSENAASAILNYHAMRYESSGLYETPTTADDGVGQSARETPDTGTLSSGAVTGTDADMEMELEPTASPAKRFKVDASASASGSGEAAAVPVRLASLKLTSPERKMEQDIMTYDKCVVKPVDADCL